LASSDLKVCCLISGGGSIDGQPYDLNILHFNSYYKYYGVWVETEDVIRYIDSPNYLVFFADILELVFWFAFFALKDLRTIAKFHGIEFNRESRAGIRVLLSDHSCRPTCSRLVYVFTVQSNPRRYLIKSFLTSDANIRKRTNVRVSLICLYLFRIFSFYICVDILSVFFP